MNIYYWSPFLSKVATVKAVLNSAISLKKYSKNYIRPYIINSIGEWNEFEKEIKSNEIDLINFFKTKKIYKNLPRYGYFKSRFSYLIIFILNFFKLHNFLNKRKNNDFFIIHLISSLPLVQLILFNYKCKFILRISGYPKLNIFRRLLWKLSSKKLFTILCPTEDTKKFLINENIFDKNKINVLYDPIIQITNIKKKKREKIEKYSSNKFILSVGRLTKQKNHKFLIKNFNEILKVEPDIKLIFLGDGELKDDLINLSKKYNVESNIFFLGHVKNVYKFYDKSLCFVLTSEWEDPGFVLVEAAASRAPIISADCPNGPKEFLKNNVCGYLFKKNNSESFLKNFNDMIYNLKNRKDIHRKKILEALKKTKNYTNFRHFKELNKIIESK